MNNREKMNHREENGCSGEVRLPSWRVGDRRFHLEKETVLVGVLNVTPDSFYDGGRFLTEGEGVARGLAMVEEGAKVIEVGGESTRPGSDPVAADEQCARIVPVIRGLVKRGVVVAVDTRSAKVAAVALDEGAVVINDVSGLADPQMLPVVAANGASLVIMHSLGEPREMQIDPRYDDCLHEVGVFLADRVRRAVAAGISEDAVAVDVGIGFGKRFEDNLSLMRGLRSIVEKGSAVMLGVSRKSFLRQVSAGEDPTDRLAGSIALSVWAWLQGVRIFRTHDVAETRKALSAVAAVASSSGEGRSI